MIFKRDIYAEGQIIANTESKSSHTAYRKLIEFENVFFNIIAVIEDFI